MDMIRELHKGTVPDGQHPHRTLFNTKTFLALRDVEPEYQPLMTGDGVVLGDVAVVNGVNGYMAPFGGIDMRRDFWRPEMIHDAISRHDFGELTEIRCKPITFDENQAPILNALLCNGWRVGNVDLDYSISVPSMELWGRTVDKSFKHGHNKALDAGLRSGEAVTDDSWRQCYELLRANRAAKGRVLSVDFDYVLRLRDAFPGLIRMHATIDENEEVFAAALLYRISREVDMVQWHGDLPEHGLGFSPMPMLVTHYVDNASERGANRVMLGISSVNGVPDGGLCQFKRNCGALGLPRFVLVR